MSEFYSLNQGFSVLICVYYKENPHFFDQALDSLWTSQTLKPSEIILVEDGKLTEELYCVITSWKERLQEKLINIALPENKGLAFALNIGLEHCKYEFVARMDADDICAPYRFEKQINFLKDNPDIDILGGQIQEFSNEIGDLKKSQVLPTKHEELIHFAKKRCPFNHPTVIYRQSVVKEAGKYKSHHSYEDYPLWVRIILNKAKVANLPEVLVFMRAGPALFHRRGGLKYAISEAKAHYQFYQQGFLTFFEFLQNIFIRFPVRIAPRWVRASIYKLFLRKI